MARLRQGLKLKFARNKNAVYKVRNVKYSYSKKTKNSETKYSYKKKFMVVKNKKFIYKV